MSPVAENADPMRPAPTFRKPHPLRRGDPVAVVAPAGPVEPQALESALALLGDRYVVRRDPHLFDRHRYLAGSDARRLNELNVALSDPDIKAVFCARGGYGSMRLVSRLAPLDARGAVKPVVGLSDITAVHAWLLQQGMVTFHGSVLTQLSRAPEDARQRLLDLLESTEPAKPLEGANTYVGGTVEGPLIGGNMAVLTRLLGTPFFPPVDGAILLLEDVAERPYMLDRMWTHLELAGVFRRVKGIALGTFVNCEDRDAGYSSDEVLRELAVESGLPCVSGFPIGHLDTNASVPLGIRVRLNADTRRLEFLEGATRAL